MKIFIASDHAGFELKEKLRMWLVSSSHEVKDFGAFACNETDDYPDFIKPLALELSQNSENIKGIILGYSGQGEAMVANRFKGVRAMVLYSSAVALAKEGNFSINIVKLAREHNNANVLSLGARFISFDEAKVAINIFLETNFSSEGENTRHLRRIKKIDN